MKGPLTLVAILPILVSFWAGQLSGPAPDFDVRSLDGHQLSLSGLRGKVVVLNFWFIACPPCRVEIPKLNQLVKDFEGKNVVFIAFAPDSEEDLRAFLEETKFDYQVVAQATPIAKEYGVTGAPTHIVVDKEGRIAAERRGAVNDPGKELGAIIRDVL